jgi:hypothetical protein
MCTKIPFCADREIGSPTGRLRKYFDPKREGLFCFLLGSKEEAFIVGRRYYLITFIDL